MGHVNQWLVYHSYVGQAMRTFEDPAPRYGQDPFLIIIPSGARLLIQSEDESRITLQDWDRPGADKKVVYSPKNEFQIWSPELHFINEDWYILYSSSDGHNACHRSQILKSLCPQKTPLGPYINLGPLSPIWSIDMTYCKIDGLQYVVWSGWENNGDEFPQNLYIASMYSPTNLGPRHLLAKPEFPHEGQILEGPQFCAETQRLYYSANSSWTLDYCTSYLQLIGPDPLQYSHWEKHNLPVAVNTGHAQPLGNNQFICHTKLSAMPGWADRTIEIGAFPDAKHLPETRDLL